MSCEKAGSKVFLGMLAVAVMVLGQFSASGQFGQSTVCDNLSPEKLAKIQVRSISSPPTPPPGFARPLAPKIVAKSLTSNMLAVPTSTWTYGCTATSAGMIFAYYDRNGYPNMYTGPANGGLCPMTDVGQGMDTPISGACSIIATQNGFDGRTTAGHADDYWVDYDVAGPDPWVGVRPEHVWGGCTADYMGTNQWKWNFDGSSGLDSNTDGATTVYSNYSAFKLYDCIPPASCGTPQTEACHGMRLFAESRGYSVLTNYTQEIDEEYSGGFTFANYMAEIDAGYPVMLQLDGHTMVGVGYDTSGSTVYVNDTWDNVVHTMTWGGSYSGMVQQGVTIIHLAPATPGSVHVTLAPAAAVTAGAKWQLDGGAWQNSGATMTAVSGGIHTVSFNDVAGWNTPASSSVGVGGGLTAEVTGTYFQLCDGVDACDRAWTSSGHTTWSVQGAVTHDGTDAAQSGAITDNEFSSLSTEVTGPANVSFWWKVDSEQDYDYLTFYVDGVENESISGAVDWAQKTCALAAGTHTLTWTYAKDSGVSDGADAGWVDQFQIVDTTPPTGTISINSNQSVTNNRAVTLSLTWSDGTGSGVARMRFSDDGAHWTAWEALKATRAYTLPAGEGYHTVRVQYRDVAGNNSATFSDFIRLDTVPPSGTIIINGGALSTVTPSVTLGLTWTDGSGSGVARMRFSDDGAHWTAWEPPTAARAYTLPGPNGYHTVRAQYRDAGGNVSAACNDYIKLQAP